MTSADLLIVEDGCIVGAELESRLRQLGYCVVGVAASRAEAIQRAIEMGPDLVLMSVGCVADGCKRDGCKADWGDTGAAEEDCTHFSVPVIYLIDQADPEKLPHAAKTNPFRYLVWPFDDEKLSTTIEMALHKHKIEMTLRESERRYRWLVENVSDVIWTTDLAMRPSDVSPSVSRLLGYSVEEAMTARMAERLTPASLEVATNALAELQAADEGEPDSPDQTKTLELEFICKDGTTVWTDVQASLLRDPAGGFGELLWVTRDASHRKRPERENEQRCHRSERDRRETGDGIRAETALRETNQELERSLQERIAELERTNAQLDRALNERRRAEARLGDLNREWLSLQSAAAATASSLDLQFVLETVTWEMAKLLKVDGCAIFRWDQEADTVSVIADYASPSNRGHEGVPEVYSLSDYPLSRRMLAERSARRLTVDELDEDGPELAYMEKRNIKGLLALPMTYQDRVIGLVEMRDCQEKRDFTDREISLAQMLSTQAASAIENARLYERAQQEIAHRMRAEEGLKESLQEKEALLKEIHHRVKNNLQVICSLLNLQLGRIEDSDALRMLRESQDRVRSMALIHEKLYRSQDLARVDFGSYLRDLTNHLMNSYRTESARVGLKITADAVPLSIDKAVPCGLITNELISNALKHAFPNGRDGEIRVRLRSERDQRLTLSVADNGVGLPSDLDLDAAETLGIQLIRVLTSQLDGTARLDSSHENGTEVSITFGAS